MQWKFAPSWQKCEEARQNLMEEGVTGADLVIACIGADCEPTEFDRNRTAQRQLDAPLKPSWTEVQRGRKPF